MFDIRTARGARSFQRWSVGGFVVLFFSAPFYTIFVKPILYNKKWNEGFAFSFAYIFQFLFPLSFNKFVNSEDILCDLR